MKYWELQNLLGKIKVILMTCMENNKKNPLNHLMLAIQTKTYAMNGESKVNTLSITTAHNPEAIQIAFYLDTLSADKELQVE